MSTRLEDAGFVGVGGLTIMLSAATVAARLTWLLITDQASLLAGLATTRDTWNLIATLVARLLDIV